MPNKLKLTPSNDKINKTNEKPRRHNHNPSAMLLSETRTISQKFNNHIPHETIKMKSSNFNNGFQHPYQFNINKGAPSISGKEQFSRINSLQSNQSYVDDMKNNIDFMKHHKEQDKLVKFEKEFKKRSADDYIPCFFFKSRSKKVMIYFHANAEDLSSTVPLLSRFCLEFKINIVAMEFPGYGIYKNVSTNKAEQIIKDAECVYSYFADFL
jgi:hypothetical protein